MPIQPISDFSQLTPEQFPSIKEFYQLLLTRAPDEQVGRGAHACFCPLVYFLEHMLGGDWYLDQERVSGKNDWSSTVLPTPDSYGDVMDIVDDRFFIEYITAQQMITLLQEHFAEEIA